MEKTTIKVCSTCHIEKDFSEFHRASLGLYGHTSECKTCKKNYNGSRYLEKKDEILAKNKTYCLKNRNKRQETQTKYTEKNKEKISEKARIYRQKNKEQLRIKKKKYNDATKEKRRMRQRQYYIKNKKIIIQKAKDKRQTPEGREQILKTRRKQRQKPHIKLHNKVSLGIRNHFRLNHIKKENISFLDMVSWDIKQLERHLKKTMPLKHDWQKDFIETPNLHIDHIIPKSKFKFKKYTDEGFQRCWALLNLQLLPAQENMSKSNSEQEYGPLFCNKQN